MEILASQLRAARALLDEDQEAVASWAELERQEVSGYERGKYKLFSSDAQKLTDAFRKRGLDFFQAADGQEAGVRWRKPGHADRYRSGQFRAARALANLSMRELQELSGVNRNFVFRLERGTLGALNLAFEKKLENFFRAKNVELVPEDINGGVGVKWIRLTTPETA